MPYLFEFLQRVYGRCLADHPKIMVPRYEKNLPKPLSHGRQAFLKQLAFVADISGQNQQVVYVLTSGQLVNPGHIGLVVGVYV